MKKLLTIIWILALVPSAFAQLSPEAKSKLETMRVGLISDRLELTPEQAEKFWPVYNQYLKERDALKEEYRSKLGNIDPKNATEEETKKMLEVRLALKTRELGLEKDYSNRLMTVISSKQVVALKQAEQEFRQRVQEIVKRRLQQQRARQNERNKLTPDRQRNRRGN